MRVEGGAFGPTDTRLGCLSETFPFTRFTVPPRRQVRRLRAVGMPVERFDGDALLEQRVHLWSIPVLSECQNQHHVVPVWVLWRYSASVRQHGRSVTETLLE